MNLEHEHGLWVLEWFPMLFDVLTVVLLVAGCLLLWLNLRSRKDVILTLKETADPDVEARHPSEFAAQEPATAHSIWRLVNRREQRIWLDFATRDLCPKTSAFLEISVKHGQ
jgi:hypothetical protein